MLYRQVMDIKEEFGEEDIRVVIVGKSLGGLITVSISYNCEYFV